MSSKTKSFFVTLAIALGMSASAHADSATDKLTQILTKSMPGLTVDSIKESAIPGMYEVVSASEVAYVTADGVHMIQGTLFNVPDRKNLTEQSLSVARAKTLKTIDATSLVVFPAKGTAKHTITVFTDPSCPFCLQLHSEIPKLNELGVTVKYALYSRSGTGTLTGRQVAEVLCSGDQKAALTKFFASPSRASSGGDCAKAKGLERIARVATQVGLVGTPYIVSDTGFSHSGYQPAEALLKTLDGS